MKGESEMGLCGIKVAWLVLVGLLMGSNMVWAKDYEVRIPAGVDGGGVDGVTVRAGDRQFVCAESIVIRTIVEGEQHILRLAKAEETYIARDGAQIIFGNGRTERTYNHGFVAVNTRLSALDYTGYSDSKLELLWEGTLAGRTLLREDARVILHRLDTELIMQGKVYSDGGVIEMPVASNLRSSGLVIIEGIFKGTIRLAVNFCTKMGGDIYGIWVPGIHDSEDEGNREFVRRKQVVKFENQARIEGDFVLAHPLPVGYEFRREEDGYWLIQHGRWKQGIVPFQEVTSSIFSYALDSLKQCLFGCCLKR